MIIVCKYCGESRVEEKKMILSAWGLLEVAVYTMYTILLIVTIVTSNVLYDPLNL